MVVDLLTRVPFFLKINHRNNKGRWYYRQVIIIVTAIPLELRSNSESIKE